jgi:2-C-methyl-D-erythritol 4-phosphate cytidylyltransferase
VQVPGDGSLQKMIMIFGVVLAGGIGSRMGNVDKPKQYLLVGEKPIIIHTLERFYVQNEFEKIIVLCPEEWVSHTKNLIKKYMKDTERIVVLRGGDTRNETIMNSLRYIEKEYGLDDDTIVVTHDSVRPFVTQRIIEENIKYAKEYGACDTAVAATDTIVYSQDNVLISDIPDRSKMYQGQTPQTFNALKLKNLYESLTEEEKATLTDAAKIFVMKGEKVHIVDGEVFNIKITYPYDLRVAEALIREER